MASYGWSERIVVGLCLAAVLAALAVAWFLPAPGGGVYIALAGGRDVIQGNLGKPDDWSFATGGRVWVDQSWGAHVLFFLVHAAGGDTGLLLFKLLLLGGIVALIAALARMRGAPLPAALLAGAAALAASPDAFALDPRLIGFLFVPFVLIALRASRGRPRRLWTAGLLVVLWANLHPSYLLGVAVLVLWAAAGFLRRLGTGGIAAAVRGSGPAAAAAVAAGILSGLGNPFGLRNLTLPLAAARSEDWRSIMGWRPVFQGDEAPPWVFLALAAVVIGVGGVRGVLGLLRRRDGRPDAGSDALFEGLLAVFVLLLPLFARSFIPLAAVTLAPTAALLFGGIDRRGAGAAVASVALLVALVLGHAWMIRYYDPGNPLRPPESLFARSVERGTLLPEGAARFLEENGIEGRLFHDPGWEGYLRWIAPRTRLFTGGRAYEIHDPGAVDRRTALLAAPDPQPILDELDVHLVAVPLDLGYAILCQKLLVGGDSSWAYVYCDRRTAVLADAGYAETRLLVERAVAGTLQYPDRATAALSRALCLASPASGAPDQVTVTALERAVSLRPADFAYALLYHRARTGGVDRESLIRYLEDQDTILGKMDADSADGIHVLRSRLNVTTYLRRLYDTKAQEDEWNAVQELNSRIGDRILALESAPWAKGLVKRYQGS